MITAASWRSSLSPARLALATGALMALLELGGDGIRRMLALTRSGLESGELWRLLGAHFVHLGWYHLALNLAGLAALVWLCPQRLSALEWMRRLLCLSLAISVALYLAVPSVTSYVGFSGVLHGLFLLGLVPQVRAGDRVALVCLLYLTGKLAWEIVMGAPLSDERAIGGYVVTQAHLFGTLAALAYGLSFHTFAKNERHPP